MLPIRQTVPFDPERRRAAPRRLRPEHRGLLHPVLAASAATTAATLGEALVGSGVATAWRDQLALGADDQETDR